MKSLNAIRAVKTAHEDELLRRPGVTGVDIGPKIVNGRKTGEMAIRVYVEKKRDNVTKADAIPAEIGGVKTDVIEKRFVLHPTKRAVAELRPAADTGTYNPLVGGISIGPCPAVGGFVFVGTLGCPVKDRSSHQMLMLTNFHVIAEKWPVGTSIAQPSRVDGGSCPSDTVGTLVRSVISEKVDGAVASISGRGHECRIEEIGPVAGAGTAAVGMKVRKRGRTTELTHGTVESIDASVNVPYDDGVHTLKQQILIEVDAAESSVFGQGGDSGSVVVDEARRVVGLYFAGTDDGSLGVANPIQAVLDELDVDLCTATRVPPPKHWLPEKTWLSEKPWRESFKDRFKEVAYEKPPFAEYIDWGWDWRVNPPNVQFPGLQPPVARPFGGSATADQPAQRDEAPELSQTSGASDTAANRPPPPSLRPPKPIKPELKEWKEFKEFKEKPEYKEWKEKPEHKEWKEKPEHKEWKDKPEKLEKPEIKELAEVPPGGWPVDPRPYGSPHFIDPSLRPDLSGGALLAEPDAGHRPAGT